MKRKWFTLLFAFVALASFQVNAMTNYLITTADTTSVAGKGTKAGVTSTGIALPDAGGYASLENLAWPGKLTITNGVGKWVGGTPVNTDQKFNLDDQFGANFTRIVDASSSSNYLKLSYSGVTYDKFIIFYENGSGGFAINAPWAGTSTAIPNGATAGYLSINTAQSNADDNLVIVLVKTATGELVLNTVKFLKDNVISYAPFAFYANQPQGRWATAADFSKCKYYTFDNIKVGKAQDTAPFIGPKKYNVFAVTQVDWVGKTTQSEANIFSATTTTTAPYYVPSFGVNTVNGVQFSEPLKGLEINGPSGDAQAIPLFTLASPEPENDCDVVSVSRQNAQDRQSQVGLGVYASQLELRKYSTYYDWDTTKVNGNNVIKYTPVTAKAGDTWNLWGPNSTTSSTGLDEARVATSLQKFAIWIDEDGNYTLYPAAMYGWEYGQSLKSPAPDGKQNLPSNVLPNSVLMYNNTDLTQVSGGVASATQGWGTKIGEWNNTTTANNNVIWGTATAPNALQNTSDYRKLFVPVPQCYDNGIGDLDGRFFYLEVQNPGALASTGDQGLASKKGAYQSNDSTKYVLSVEVVGTKKHLIMLPKEKVRSYANNADGIHGKGNKWYNDLMAYKAIEGGLLLPDYWSQNPYDSVNMAAQWAVININKGTDKDPQYLLVNMLGDTLQYNNDLHNISGGYLPVSNLIAATAVSPATTGLFGFFSPEGGANPSQWFAQNSWATDGSQVKYWTASGIPGNNSGFVLSTDNGTKFVLDPTGSWYQNGIHAKGDSIYFQQDVNLAVASAPALENSTTVGTAIDCAGGLMLSLQPIYYVPNYSKSFSGEDPTLGNTAATINTSDKSFKDGKMAQDSLSAYLYLNGGYGIKEAAIVGNDLFLGAVPVEWNGVTAAALDTTGTTDLTFTPLASAIDKDGNTRTVEIRNVLKSGKATLANTTTAGVDTLYGETYKWFIVQKGDLYLTFDTIAPNSKDNRLKVGFVFAKTDLANAVPVRLYQPLVGDKLQGNFIFQFQLPVNTYNVAHPEWSKVNTWPDINKRSAAAAADPTAIISGGARVFGQLSNQSNFINATMERSEATRFTYALQTPSDKPCNCPKQFIAPNWMAQEKLLSLPVENQIWTLTQGTGFGFGSAKNNEATVVNTGITQLKHILVDSIKNGVWDYTKKVTGAKPVRQFQKDVTVYLYNIVNSDGKYLTVGTSTYQFNSASTDKDVTGVNLVWADQYKTWNADSTKNQPSLQLFAISGTQAGPDDKGWYADTCTYVYLPLASYKVDYSQGKVDVTSGMFYNTMLGMGGKPNCDIDVPFNNVAQAFRVSQYSPIGGVTGDPNQKNLIVANASGLGATSVVPVELKWKKLAYDTIGCVSQLIKDVGYNKNGSFYYTWHDSICTANSNTLLAHWNIDHPAVGKGDIYLHTITPEGIKLDPIVPGYKEADIVADNKMLKGTYYFNIIEQNATKDTTKVRVFDFSTYNYSTNYNIKEDTFLITCVGHTLPYLDLEKDANYELPAQLATLESKFFDRNLSDATNTGKGPSKVVSKDGLSWQVYSNKETEFDSLTFVKAYKTNVRQLGVDGHVIPYYSFSITRGGDEYFLCVYDGDRHGNDKDSLYWTKLTPAQIQSIQDDNLAGINKGSNNLSRYKFCLPFEMVNGEPRMAEYPEGSGNMYNSVYIQSMDTTVSDMPYFVTIGAPSDLATVVRASDVVFSKAGMCGSTSSSLAKNIYSIDYNQIDPYQVTTWIFGGQQPSPTEWVPLNNSTIDGVIVPATTTGLLTDFNLQGGGVTFVQESGQDINHGILTGFDNRTNLFFQYEGTEQIGTYAKVPIYYYRIGITPTTFASAKNDTVWLTDSYGKSGDYIYYFGTPTQTAYQVGYFGDLLPNTKKNYDAPKTPGAPGFLQTLGLRYVNTHVDPIVPTDGSIAEQTFVVVANANYLNPVPSEYRYLAAVNNHLVFVRGIENAMVFTFGKADGGKWTGVEVVGTGATYGVTGGVKLLNQAGTVVSIYSVDGSLIKNVQVTSADQTVDAPRGVVIVKSAGNATKVVVK